MEFGFDDLSNPFLRDDSAGAGRADSAWREIAAAAGWAEDASPPASELAGLLNRRANVGLTPADLFHHLHELASSASHDDAGTHGARLSELIRLLNPNVLAAALAASKVHAHTKRVLNQLVEIAGPGALLALGRAAAAAYGRPLSPTVDALVQKIARGVDGMPTQTRAVGLHALRDLVKAMVETWSGAAVTLGGSGYDVLFTDETDAKQERAWSGRLAVTPERIVATSFEVGALGSAVWNAVGQLSTSEEGVRRILEMVKRAPPGNNSVEVVAQQFANTTRLLTLLREDPIDFTAVDVIATRIPDAAAAPLLDALIDSEQGDVRTALLKRLVTLGPSVCALAADRLQSDDRWYVQRDMLRLIRETKCETDPKIIDRFVRHSDVRVREEAVQILLDDPVERDRVLALALRDPEHSVLKIGLKAARQSAPEGVMPFIAKRIQEPGFPSELRMASIHVLARSNSVLALEPLLRFVVGGTTMLGKPKLAAKSPEMLVALDGLARMWPHERRAAAMLALARESGDPEILAAAEGSAAPIEPIPEDPD